MNCQTQRNESMLELRKFVAPEFVFGSGASLLAAQYANNLRVKKALLVIGPHVSKFKWAEDVVRRIADDGLETVVFSSISPNPRDSEVMAGAEIFDSQGCNGIIAIGGGSTMDCAKAIGAVSANRQHVLEFEGVDKVNVPGPPLICVPTTSGSASEVSQFSIVNDTTRKVKIAIISKTMIPDAALMDPVTTTTMSRELTAHTGLDALTHAVEAYVSNAHSPFTDMHALESVRMVANNLSRSLANPNDLEARAGMMMASTLAGLAFSNAILGAVHAMAHSLGGFLDLPHGQCNAILLDHVIDYNFDAVPERYCEIGRALGANIPEGSNFEDSKKIVLAAIRKLKAETGVTQQLAALGVDQKDLRTLAEKAANDPCLLTNPKTMNLEDIERLYERAC